jgi:hypothetical protein
MTQQNKDSSEARLFPASGPASSGVLPTEFVV